MGDHVKATEGTEMVLTSWAQGTIISFPQISFTVLKYTSFLWLLIQENIKRAMATELFYSMFDIKELFMKTRVYAAFKNWLHKERTHFQELSIEV